MVKIDVKKMMNKVKGILIEVFRLHRRDEAEKEEAEG